MLLSARDGNTMFDMVIKSGSPLENFVAICIDNSIGFDALPQSGEKITVDNGFISTPPPNIVYSKPQPTTDIRKLVSVDNQTIFDIALMTYGNLESVSLLKVGNLDEIITPQSVFEYDYKKITNYVFYSQIQNKFGYICTSDLNEGVVDNNVYLSTEDNYFITTEDGYFLAI